jgi:phage-related tail fiber protein
MLKHFAMEGTLMQIKRLTALGTCLLLVACAPAAKPLQQAATSTVDPLSQQAQQAIIASWKVVRECNDGTTVYKLADGTYAIWVSKDNTTGAGHWDALADGITPDSYCATVPAPQPKGS